MKQLKMTTEGTWRQANHVDLTTEQQAVMTSVGNAEAKLALAQYINANRYSDADAADASLAQAKYAEIKPVLAETDTYQLIAMDVTIDGDSVTGILNCRVNEGHRQIRF